MKMRNLLLGAILLLLTIGCNKSGENENGANTGATNTTSAPVVTNAPATNK